jgi:Leucine-rich repeat (LRR) protein
LTDKDLQIDSVSEGIEVLSKNISFSSTLIILDDVDDVAQLEAFLPLKDVLHPDSLILITSRNRDVLTSSGIAELSIYKLTCLDLQHSQQLFCSHAFCQPYPPPGFHSLVDEFSRACNGLPLSLKVFGALLCGNNNKSYWGDQLRKLREIILPKEILKCLEISYDALSGEERQIFLDVACYFIGEDTDMAIRIWDACGWKGSVGLLNLQNKSLVDVDRDNKIEMHDHLRDLGRDIADREMPIRLWRRTNNIQVPWQQLYNGQGITLVRGIRAVDNVIFYGSTIPGIINRCKSWSIDQFRKLRTVETEYKFLPSLLSVAMSQNLIWLRLNNCPYSYLPSCIPMKNLRVLDVKGNKFLWRGKSQAPLELRELYISSSLLKFPKSIGQLKHIEKIVVDFRGIGQLKALPEEFCGLRSLKYLHLTHQHSMERLPASFGHLTNLQHLDLSHCMTLRMLPNTFSHLIRLKYLNLRNCFNLTMSDETFDYISTLEYLELSKCHSIKVLPLQVAYQTSMEEIHLLSMIHLKELPEDIENLCNLEVLSIGSPLLERLPRSLGRLTSLKQLRLEGCDKLECLPNSLGMLTQLSTLRIRACGILYLPQEAVKMNNLVKLSLLWCPLRELPWQELVEGQRETLADPTGRGKMIEMDLSIYNAQHQQCMHRLEYLELLRTEISEIFFSQGVCPNLKHLDIQDCYNLVKVGGLPHTLITVKLLGCEKLREVGGLCNLTELQELNIRGCKVEELPGLERLISLKKLEVSRCQKLRQIWGLWQLNKLRVLDVNHCHALEELPGVENMRSLEQLSAINCYSLQWWGDAREKLKSRLQGAFACGFQHLLGVSFPGSPTEEGSSTF